MKAVFTTNRPNYCHRRFAESVNARFFYVKHYIPDGIPLLSLPINGFLSSLSLPDADVYFSESIMDYYPVYYKNPEGRKIILLAEDTLYKLPMLPKPKKDFIVRLLKSADGFLAVSDICRHLLLKYVEKPVRIVYPFPHKEFFHVKANINSKNILFIGRNDKSK